MAALVRQHLFGAEQHLVVAVVVVLVRHFAVVDVTAVVAVVATGAGLPKKLAVAAEFELVFVLVAVIVVVVAPIDLRVLLVHYVVIG